MHRLAAPFVLIALAAPALAAEHDAPDMAEASEVSEIVCEKTGEETSCTFDSEATDAVYGFCMAVDAEGTPLANSTSPVGSWKPVSTSSMISVPAVVPVLRAMMLDN